MNQAGNTLFMRIASPARVIRPLLWVVLSRSLQVRFGICLFRGSCMREYGCLPFTWANRSVHGGQMVGKIQHWLISSRNLFYHLYKSVPFTKRRLRTPELGIKDGFEVMEHEFSFGIFRPEKQDYSFRYSVAPGHFSMERPEKVLFHLLSTGFSGKLGKW